MSLTQQIISSQKEAPLKEMALKQKQLQKQLQEQEKVLKSLQASSLDESNVRLEKRQNLSIKRKRQIEKHRNRYVKEAIKHNQKIRELSKSNSQESVSKTLEDFEKDAKKKRIQKPIGDKQLSQILNQKLNQSSQITYLDSVGQTFHLNTARINIVDQLSHSYQPEIQQPEIVPLDDVENYHLYKKNQQAQLQIDQLIKSRNNASPLSVHRSSALSKMQIVAMKYSPQLNEPREFRNSGTNSMDLLGLHTNETTQEYPQLMLPPQEYFPTSLEEHLQSVSETNRYLKEMHDLQVLGHNKSGYASGVSPSPLNMSSPGQVTTSGAVHQMTGYDGTDYSSPMGTQNSKKKILFSQRQIKAGANQEHLKFLMSTKGQGSLRGGHMHHLLTQNERFQSIPENVINEGTLGATASTKNWTMGKVAKGEINIQENRNNNNIQSPMDVSQENMSNLPHQAKYNSSEYQINSKGRVSSNKKKDDKSGKISLQSRNGRDTMMGVDELRATARIKDPISSDKEQKESRGNSNVGMYGTIKEKIHIKKPLKITTDNPELISLGEKSRKENNFGASMYNVSPIEVYIENRSINPSIGQNTQNSKFKFPQIKGKNNSGQVTQVHGFTGFNHKMKKIQMSPNPRTGGSFFQLGKNPNNPYQSYYIGGKKYSPKGATNIPIQILESPTDPRVKNNLSRDPSALGAPSQFSQKSGAKPGSKLSNLAPIYKGKQTTFIEIGSHEISSVENYTKRNLDENFIINELQDLQEQTAEDAEDLADDLIRRKEGIKRETVDYSRSTSQYIDENNIGLSVMSSFYAGNEAVSPRLEAFKSKEVQKILQMYHNQSLLQGENTPQILMELATLGSKQLVKEEKEKRNKYKSENKALDENLYTNADTLKNKRNYEELYYKQRTESIKNQYLQLLVDKFKKQGDNLKPKYMEETKAKNKQVQDLEFIKMSYRSPQVVRKHRNYSNLETILQKQQIAIASEGQQSFQLENLIEEESNMKIDIDEQIQNRFKELMDKGLYFTPSKKKKKTKEIVDYLDEKIDDGESTLTKGWEGWETDLVLPPSPQEIESKKKLNKTRRVAERVGDVSEISDRWKAIQQDPNIQKEDVLPENDEILQIIKERYMGLDDEHNRRRRLKDQLLQRDKLHDMYSALNSPKKLLDVLSAQFQSQMGNIEKNPFDLPQNKILAKNSSKVSLSPTNIMPGGSIKELDVDMRNFIRDNDKSGLSRNMSIATLQPRINRGISQATIATLISLKENEEQRKKNIEKIAIVNRLRKDEQLQLEKKQNQTNDEYYSKVLNNSNFVLPSLFNERVASIALPMQEIMSTRSRLGGLSNAFNSTLNQNSLRMLNQQAKGTTERKFKSVNNSKTLAIDEQEALTFRKDLTYLDKLSPKVRDTTQMKNQLQTFTQEELKESFKRGVILKHQIRGPKFKLTEYAQYMKNSSDKKYMQEQLRMKHLETGNQLRELFEQNM